MGEFKMKRPKQTATKEIIWEYVEGIEAELKAKQEGKFDPAAVKETERKKDVAIKAEKIISRGIVNDTIMDEYNALEERIEDMKAEIDTIAGITVNVGTFAALIEANNLEIAEVKAIKDEMIAEKTAELEALKAEIKALTDSRAADEKAYNADLKLKREREAADYKYDLEREHKKEDDEWSDTKTTRENTLAAKEIAVEERETKCVEIEADNDKLKVIINSVPDRIAEEVKAATDAAEKKANSTLAIREAAMKKEVTFDLKMKDAENATLKEALTKAEANLAIKEAELKEAYVKMNDLATKSVQAGQVVYANKDAK